MLKRLSSFFLLGGLLGLAPAAAQAAPATRAQTVQADPSPVAGYDLMHKGHDDDHYRCMYRCKERHRYKHDHYKHDKHDKHRHKHRYRHHKNTCWYYHYGKGRWYRARCSGRHSHHYDHHH